MRLTSKAIGLMTMVAVLLTTAVSAVAAPGKPAQEPPLSPGGVFTPVVVSPIPQKKIVPVRGSDGRYHVMYELQLLNSVPKPARLNSVRVLDAAGGRVVETLTPKQLIATEALHKIDRSPVKDTSIGANQARILFLSLSFKSRAAVPAKLTHRLDVTGLEPITASSERFRYLAGPTKLSRLRPPILQPPVEGTGWMASDGCCAPGGHVSAIYGLNGRLQAAERYAIDWFKIAPDGRVYHGDPSMLSSWDGYGAAVLAVGDGVVTSVQDGRPEQAPLAMPSTLSLPELPGNDVTIRLKGGFSAVYAHLVSGSVSVKVGQRVSAGQQIGRLGNSGGTLAPHLHFHLVDGPDPVTSDGYPYVIDSFRRSGQTDVQTLLKVVHGEAIFPAASQLKPVGHKRELPLGFTINDFPGG